ncbi:hypothetical protein TPHA_0C03690 [Tetrapisispora phaffii CBS 4417]|uniref:Inheritance of peroxisomes protein 2 n=1 Tax=Tetrapisispora phaffii (strain ATCC 24235 / CBS 4417 / NBRC 1672 / NRRL Y-8282 / UCD 70-5) TaxID=1071381 RepID=G8BQK9_TETPH|nr:hypothetical protein TPHA_0C03690 [Tetrapisispora phaffii CBS 4417]CCE62521.1 hypothetical protein TPHA_0C03690 [Tetrapisispora phaffii CBS 4417]
MKPQYGFPKLHFAGLQIYSDSDNYIENNAIKLQKEELCDINYQLDHKDNDVRLSIGQSEELTPVMGDNGFDRLSTSIPHMRNVTDWTMSTLNEHSPSFANLDVFENIKKVDSNNSNNINSAKIISNEHIAKYFRPLPTRNNNDFLEEFRYTIISSNILNDSEGYRFKFDIKNSILDFHSSKSANTKKRNSILYHTKYGICKSISGDKFKLYRTFNYSKTIINSLRIIRYLSNKRKLEKTKYNNANENSFIIKTICFILICINISSHQQFFYNQCIKYKFMINLKEFLKILQKSDDLIHKYHNVSKELAIYKPLIQKHHHRDINLYKRPDSDIEFNNSEKEFELTLNKINEILTSVLNLQFHQVLKHVIEILPMTDKTELLKYCEIYAIDLPTLYEYINFPAPSIKNKIDRFDTLKKIMLLCLLSITEAKVTYSNNSIVINQISNIFGVIPDDIIATNISRNTLIKNIKDATIIIKNMEEAISPFIQVLVANRNLLYLSIDSQDDNSMSKQESQKLTQDESNHNFLLINIINQTKSLEKAFLGLSSTELKKNEEMNSITNHISNILETWVSMIDKDSISCQKAETTNIGIVNNRFSIDVYNSDRESSVKILDTDILKKQIDIKEVGENTNDIFDVEQVDDFEYAGDENQSVLFFTNEEDFYNSSNKLNKSGISTQKMSTREMTDEELRQKLDQKISILAAENRKVKEKLRTKKSFDLLRNENSNILYSDFKSLKKQGNLDTRSRSSRLRNYSSEETIPIIYELKALFDAGS